MCTIVDVSGRLLALFVWVLAPLILFPVSVGLVALRRKTRNSYLSAAAACWVAAVIAFLLRPVDAGVAPPSAVVGGLLAFQAYAFVPLAVIGGLWASETVLSWLRGRLGLAASIGWLGVGGFLTVATIFPGQVC